MSSYVLPPKTEEQATIIQQLATDNLIVEAVAGSGKTTTSLYIAKHYVDLNILLITYNAKLKAETRKKVLDLKLKNLTVHSFHSFGLKYYQEKKCTTDQGIQKIIDQQPKPCLVFKFDVIIIDEAQDITPLYYEFICKIITDNECKAKICLFGDKHQAIYSYNDADARYLSLADHFFDFNSSAWSKRSLSETFRVNDKIVAFINKIFYQKDFMNSFKSTNILPEYVIGDTFSSNILYKKIKQEIINYGAENIFILAASVKSGKSPIRNFANRLVNEGFVIFVPTTDDEEVSEEDLKGKLVFCTFHQVKGLERKLVVVFGFDDGYFKYYNKNHNPKIPTNALYVAITRASEKLMLIHHYKNNFLPFLDYENLENYCQVTKFLKILHIQQFDNLAIDEHDIYEKKDISVTEIVRHIPQNILNKCLNLIAVKKIANSVVFKPIKFQTHVKEKNYVENVSTITGVAIPLYYEWSCKGDITKLDIFKHLLNLLHERKDYAKDNFPDLFKYQKDIKKLATAQEFTIKNLLFLANLELYLKDGFNFKLNQISAENYNWITQEELDRSRELLRYYVDENSLYDQEYYAVEKVELHNKTLRGYIDCIDRVRHNIWEFKCVNLVKETYFLQLAVYVYLFITQRNSDLATLNSDTPANNAAVSKFAQNKVEIGDIISFKKWNKLYEGETIMIRKKQLIVKILPSNKIKKIMYKHFQKNISYENKTKKLATVFNYALLNIKKHEIYHLQCSYENLKKIVDLLIWNKFFEFGKMSEIEFINLNNQIKQKYLSTTIKINS